MEKNKHPPSFLQDVHHLPRFPGGTVAQIRPPLWPLPPRGCRGFPEFSSIPHVFIEHLLCYMPSIVLGSFGNVLSCLRGASGNFWGVGGRAVHSRAFGWF